MDRPVLILEAPELNDEAAEIVLDFLQELLNAFDAHFYHRLQRRKQLLHRTSYRNEKVEDQDPI